jgi:hypothetical protein
MIIDLVIPADTSSTHTCFSLASLEGSIALVLVVARRLNLRYLLLAEARLLIREHDGHFVMISRSSGSVQHRCRCAKLREWI